MKQYLKAASFIVLILFSGSLQALDFGLLLDQNVDSIVYGNEWRSDTINYSGTLIPRVSALLGDNMEFVFSAGLAYQIRPWVGVPEFLWPELLRTEMTLSYGMSEFKVGRMPYRDPLGIIAEGLFDGVQFSYDTRMGTLSAGGWYTGFLYKWRASIDMTDDETRRYDDDLDYGKFLDTYFAPRRILSLLGWEHPAAGGLFDVKVAALGQFDLAKTKKLNSQYLAAKIAMPFRYFIVDLGGCFELMEYDDDWEMAMAAEAGFTLMLPTRLENHFTLRGRYTSGAVEDGHLNAFKPLTTVAQGNLLKVKISGLSIMSLGYHSRLHRVLSTELIASYFVRSDKDTYTDYPVKGTDSGGYFLGPEFFLRVLWNISTGIQMDFGGGVFLPSLGDAAHDEIMLWRAELNMVISIL